MSQKHLSLSHLADCSARAYLCMKATLWLWHADILMNETFPLSPSLIQCLCLPSPHLFVILFPTSLCLSSHWPQSGVTEEEGQEESVGASGMRCFKQKLSGEKNERREWHCEQCLSQLWCVNWWQVWLAISVSEIMFLKEELIARKRRHDVFGCFFFSVCVCSCGVLFLCIHLNLSF